MPRDASMLCCSFTRTPFSSMGLLFAMMPLLGSPLLLLPLWPLWAMPRVAESESGDATHRREGDALPAGLQKKGEYRCKCMEPALEAPLPAELSAVKYVRPLPPKIAAM